MSSRKMSRGFTLVELLVVIAIIAVLMAILLPSLSAAKQQSVRLTCLSNLRQFQLCSTMYSSENSSWYIPVVPGWNWNPSTPTTWWSEDPTVREFLQIRPFKPVWYAEAPPSRICPNATYTRSTINPTGTMNIRSSYGMNYTEYMDGNIPELFMYGTINNGIRTWISYRSTRVNNPSSKMAWACSLSPSIRASNSSFYVGEMYPNPNDQIAYRHGPGNMRITTNTKYPDMTVGYTGTNIAFYDGHAEAMDRKLVDSTFLTPAQIDRLWYAYK